MVWQAKGNKEVFRKVFDSREQAWKFIAFLTTISPQNNLLDSLRMSSKGVVEITIKNANDSPAFKMAIAGYTTSDESDDSPTIKLYCDGGSRGNPGPSASGYVLYDDGHLIARGGEYLGPQSTNNQAEYNSLKIALEACLEINAKSVIAYMDSQLVVKQVKGEYKIKNDRLKNIHSEISGLIASLQDFKINYIPRSLNKEADSIVNKVLDDRKSFRDYNKKG